MKRLPNIIFIVMDTLGAQHTSLYGYHRPTTPNLERIAQECTVYQRCFAPGCWTIPSHGSMFTGLYPSQHGANEVSHFLNDNIQHLVPILQMLGYRTFGISSNPIVNPITLCPGFDFFRDFGTLSSVIDHDFQHFLPCSGAKNRLRTLLRRVRQNLNLKIDDWGRKKGGGESLWKLYYSLKSLVYLTLNQNPIAKSAPFTESTVSLFQEIIERQSAYDDRPFFLFINFMEAHEFINPPRKWRQFSSPFDTQLLMLQHCYKLRPDAVRGLLRVNRNLYDDAIRYQDAAISMIWKTLKESIFDENTAFILTSDHGEHFGEKERYQHQLSLYNELVWIPLLARFPSGLKRAEREERLVSLTDLYATILDLAESPFPHPESSISLLGTEVREFAVSQIVLPERWVYIQSYRTNWNDREVIDFPLPILAMMSASGRKAILRHDDSFELYDLNVDMAEENDLAPDLPAEARANLRLMFDQIKNETGYFEARESALKITEQ